MKPTALIILDGWGQRAQSEGNAVQAAAPVYFQHYLRHYPHSELSASGLDVGLPAGQMGNSEVGHLNIGAGRIVYQPLTQIHKDIEEGTLFTMPVFQEAFQSALESGRKFHLLGLVSDGGVHSHLEHLIAMLGYAREIGLEQVYVHAFMDGRDTSPTGGIEYLRQLQEAMDTLGVGRIATITGRYYAMDRDQRWERIKIAYDAIVHGLGQTAESMEEAMLKSYQDGVTDEFIKPIVLDPSGRIETADSVLFFNFRPDRARQMTRALTEPDFDGFITEPLALRYYTLTQYDVEFTHLKAIYPPSSFKNTIGEYLSAMGYRQFRIAETEKYAHVTFFFNGGREEPFPGEERVLIASPKVATYDLKPEMSAEGVKDRLIEAVRAKKHDFYLCNFANPDMVGHTGVFEAAVQAVRTVDKCLGQVLDAFLAQGIQVLITADHGNCEEMYDAKGELFTAHTTNPVPLILVGAGEVTLRSGGRLADLSPTILELMGLPIPEEMTGHSLIGGMK